MIYMSEVGTWVPWKMPPHSFRHVAEGKVTACGRPTAGLMAFHMEVIRYREAGPVGRQKITCPDCERVIFSRSPMPLARHKQQVVAVQNEEDVP